MAVLYGYNASEGEVRQAVQWTMAGGTQGTLSAWESMLKNYAMQKYSPFADRIKAGETVNDIAKPYIDAYKEVMEQDTTMSDAAIQKALQGDVADSKVGPQAKPVWQFQQELRQDPRWGYTQNARESVAKTLTTLGTMFGKVAGS